MRTFRLFFTGDYLDAEGKVAYGDIGLNLLREAPNIKVAFLLDQKPEADSRTYWDNLYSMEIRPGHIRHADGLVIFRPWVKASAFAHGAESLVVIGRAGAGYDKIDLEACTAHDVAVFNAPDTLTHSTASAALTFILALSKKLQQQQRLVREGRWDQQPAAIGDELEGQTLGIIGLGKSGTELSRLIAPFKMGLLAFSPRASPAQANVLGVRLVSSLDTLLRESDFISLHCRLEPCTRHMLGEREFRLMKPTAYFINVARGELVRQSDLVRCLRERAIAGAGLDVFEEEPLRADDPLLKLDNVILTPHWLASTRQAACDTMAVVTKGMLHAAQGQLPEHIVNAAVLDRPGFLAKLGRFRPES